MIREIEFRGMCAATNEWVYGLPSTETTLSNSITHISQFFGEKRKFGRTNVLIKPETLGQSTGLFDKNGKEIYGGDVVKANNINYAVSFNKRWAAFELCHKHYSGELFAYFFFEIRGVLEVIGNKFENPELLEANAK